LGDCYIIFAGGTGTISELGMAWGLARLYFGHHKPLILYGSLWYPILEAIAANLPLRQQELEVYRIIVDSKQVLSTIREFEAKM
jgi:predicted Rossmann-fold nucleotide-binding protein